MPEPKRWISRIRAVEPPDLWDEVGRRREAAGDEPGRRDALARRPRMAALATGVVAGALALVVVAVVLRSAPDDREGPLAPSHSVGTSPSPSESPEPARLDPVVLTGALDDPLTPWDEVATIPVGSGSSEIGSTSDCLHCALPVPAGLAVAEDGSFWIGDPLNGRVAHFGVDGTFIEGVATERGPGDLTLVGDQIYALLEQGASKIQLIGSGGAGRVITVNNGGRGLHVEALIGGQGQLLGLISGAERLLGSYWAFAFVDPATGQVTPAPGLVTHAGTLADLQPVFDTRPPTFELRWSNGERTTAVQDVVFDFTRAERAERVTIGDMYLRTCTRYGMATVVSVGDAQGNPVGAWFLEFSTLGREPVFERIEVEGLGIGETRRSLTLGADGFTYRMALRGDELHILRR